MPVCCPPGSTGPKARDTSIPLKGAVQSMGELEVYVTGQLSENGLAVVVCEDIMGIDSGRTKEIADRLAVDLNCLVVLPEFLMKDTWPESYGAPGPCNFAWFIPFLRRNNDKVTTKRFEDNVLPYLNAQGAKSLAWFGVCLGGCIGAALAANSLFKCGVACHPAFQGFGLAGGHTMDEVMSAIKGPVLYFPTVNEPKIAQPNGAVQKLIQERAKQECLVEPYLDQVHGFVNRGDISQPSVARDVEKVLVRAVEFIRQKAL